MAGCNPTMSAPVSRAQTASPVASRAAAFGVGEFPPSGSQSGGDGRRRARSRLSLNTPRLLRPLPHTDAVAAGEVDLGREDSRHSAARMFPSAPSVLQHHHPPYLQPAALPPPGERNAVDYLFSGSSSVTSGQPPSEGRIKPAGGDTLGSTPLLSSAALQPTTPPPPFVGLQNMGDTCYVNVVVQALMACSAAMMMSTLKTSGPRGDGGRPANASAGDRHLFDREARDGNFERGSSWHDSPFLPAVDGEEGVSMQATAGNDAEYRNPVLQSLEMLLEELDKRNRALLAQYFSNDLPQAGAPQAVAPPSVSGHGEVHLESSGCTGTAVGSDATPASATPQLHEALTRKLDVLTTEKRCAEAITPTTLVELIRGGWLSAGRASTTTGEQNSGRLRRGGGLAGATALADFGSGQQCVSELLGKLLDLHEPGVAREGDTAVMGEEERREGSGSANRLRDAFLGALCTRMLCVECERDRVSREKFTELTLPPLVRQPPPPPPNCKTTETWASGDNASPEQRTIQDLVEIALGSESLEGTNKVWCQACRQWTEAERRSLLHSPPRLLALHVRPSTGGRLHCPPAADTGAKLVKSGAHEDHYAETLACDPNNAKRRTRARSGNGAVIDRALTVRGDFRCHLHNTVGAARRAACGQTHASPPSSTISREVQQSRGESDDTLPQQRDSDDVSYDLIGVILHQGHTLGSGHYTFALNVPSIPNTSSDRASRDCPSAVGASADGAEHATCREKSDPRNSKSESLLKVAREMSGVGGEGRDGAAVWSNREGFVLFDDAHVRWLSTEEENTVLRGGDASGGLGDAFLVFYARRLVDVEDA